MSHRSAPMLVSLMVVMAVATAALPAWPESCPPLTTCFTPGGSCTDAIAHNKVIVIDGETVLTGSFNFTKAAQEKNAENLLIIRDPPSRRSMRRTGTPIASIVSYMWAAGSGNRQGCPLHAPSGYWFMCRSRMT
jgi:PLD-like domain